MSGQRRLDLENWPRREHFHFFRDFELPFFNLCADVDVTDLLSGCRQPGGPSFFAAAAHCSLQAVNEVEEFHYRLDGDGVAVYDVIHGGTTVMMPNETFSFAYFDWDPDFDRFVATVKAEIDRVGAGPMVMEPRDEQVNLVHYSVIPWLSFTSFAHARRLVPTDSVPKIVFGRYRQSGDRQRMPVSVEVHHALMDGLHVGRFFALFEEYLAQVGSRLWEGGSRR